jgi:hypothetical protein
MRSSKDRCRLCGFYPIKAGEGNRAGFFISLLPFAHDLVQLKLAGELTDKDIANSFTWAIASCVIALYWQEEVQASVGET